MSRVEDIKARLDAATPGPWEAQGQEDNDTGFDVVIKEVAVVQYRRDADLIAHAPTDLRDLLAIAEEARNVLQAHDEAAEPDAEMDWTGPMVDLRLRAALDRLDAPEATR